MPAGTGKVHRDYGKSPQAYNREELFDEAKRGKSIPVARYARFFAESEDYINYMGEGRPKERIAAGVIDSVTKVHGHYVERKLSQIDA